MLEGDLQKSSATKQGYDPNARFECSERKCFCDCTACYDCETAAWKKRYLTDAGTDPNHACVLLLNM